MMDLDGDALTARRPLASASFDCSRGHGRAGAVHLFRGEEGDWAVMAESFVCRQTGRLGEGAAMLLRAALERGLPEAVYQVNLEYAPFYCPRCAAVYCGACWHTYNVFDDEMPGWFEETRGTCPEGHERMLVD